MMHSLHKWFCDHFCMGDHLCCYKWSEGTIYISHKWSAWVGPGLKPGRVIRVIQVKQVTFCLGQVGLTRFIKYPDLTQILQ